MAVISWGKPRIFIGANNAALSNSTASWYELATPAEDTTNLTATQGDKTEAKIEGGEAEATKYKAATFELTMNVRMAKDRELPDPMISGSGYASAVAVILVPEDATAPGFYCPTCSLSIIESYTSADGAMWEITLNPNVPEQSTGLKAVNWDAFTIGTESSGKFPISGSN